MKIMITFVGLLTILGGLLPFLSSKEWLPGFLEWLPTSGPGYQALIIAIGLIAVYYGLRSVKKTE